MRKLSSLGVMAAVAAASMLAAVAPVRSVDRPPPKRPKRRKPDRLTLDGKKADRSKKQHRLKGIRP